MRFQKHFAFFFVFFVFFSCKKNETPTPILVQEIRKLISATPISELSVEQLTKQAGSAVIFGIVPKYSVKVYKVVYKTTNTDGKEIEASGAMILPTSTDALPMASQQHGTIRSENDAPSNFQSSSEAAQAGVLMASMGYLVACPDYIGYGASKAYPHTYEHREGLATASLDMLRALKNYVSDNKLNWNKRLYITGYSEGGYATMSLQKKIEETASTEFQLKASSCGAGAYNKTATMKNLVNESKNEVASYNALYIWVLLTYDRIHGLNRAMSAYFKEPYATQISKDKESTQINAPINTIFSDALKAGINNGTDTGFLNAVKDNDVFDWKPITPTKLFHGNADDLVPYFNSKTAYDAMISKGADVQLVTISGGNHSSSVPQYLIETIQFFKTTEANAK